MRLKVSKSKNSASFYVTKTIYKNKKESTITVEKLGTEKELREKLKGQDPYEWAKAYIKELNEKEKEGVEPNVMAEFSPTKLIDENIQRSFNGGYLFLQNIYYQLGLDKICNEISRKHKFEFNLNSILSRLVYGRIIFPGSKLSTYEQSSKFIEKPEFELHHIYRALEIISKETDFIQSALYKNSLKLSKRNTGVLYYDCTNYFFETEEEEGLKQYGVSKEHRPSPIVQMGLFMDGDGIPLAFNITNGNTNEQVTLKPLEKQILSDFELSKFVVCTDAGLASNSNRKFNDVEDRAFITTQSIKKLKKHLKDWALDTKGWYLSSGSSDSTADDLEVYDISKIDDEIFKSKVFYKERWINENGFEQRLIVTYSIKYRNYQRKIRNAQIDRAIKLLSENPSSIKKSRQNDYKRFIEKTSCTKDGEIASKESYDIKEDLIKEEAKYDGYYSVCTNLEDEVSKIVEINKNRWEIEECFKILKSEFKARPVYLKRDDRIEAHFTTCFIALILYRYLEKKLGEKFTCSEIISGLRNMNFHEIKGDGYIPTYTRNEFTNELHESFGFRTDYEIVTTKNMKNILKSTKK